MFYIKKIMVREVKNDKQLIQTADLYCSNKGEFVLSVLSVVRNLVDNVVVVLTDLGNEYADQ